MREAAIFSFFQKLNISERLAAIWGVESSETDYAEQVQAGLGAMSFGVLAFVLTNSADLHLAALAMMIVGSGLVMFALPRWKPNETEHLLAQIFPPMKPLPRAAPRPVVPNPRRSFAPVLTITNYRRLCAIIFLSIVVLLYNPFVVIDGRLKFSIIVGLVAAAIIFAGAVLPIIRFRTGLMIVVFVLLYAVAAARINDLGYDHSFDHNKAATQPLVWLLLFFGSIMVARRVGIRTYTNIFAWWAGIVCCALLANYQFLVDPAHFGRLGDFSEDSYQQVSTIFGIVGIICFTRAMEWRRGSAVEVGACAVVITCLFVIVFLTPARGEQMAFLAALAATRFPRLSLMALAASVLAFPLILDAMEYYQLPSAERFRIALNLGWNEPRVVLLMQSISLIMEDGATWLFGGGADYFQSFYDLPEAMHPHNFILEALMSGGIILALATFAIFVAPVAIAYYRMFRRRPVPLDVFAIAAFILILSLKSTAFTSNWLLAISAPFFLYLRTYTPRRAKVPDRPLMEDRSGDLDYAGDETRPNSATS